MFLDRLRRLPNPYLYDFLFHGKGDAETAVAVGLEGEQGQELDESGNCVELNNTTFDTAVHCSFNASTEGMQNIANDTRADKTTGVPNAKKKKPPDHTHLFKYRGKNSTSVSPLIVADHTHEYGAARRLLKKKQQQEEKLLVAKNIMINNTKKQLGEFRSLVTLLHREFDAQVGDENNTTGVVENEILKSHLLEGIISHRGIMKRPRAKPPLAMAASAGQNEGVTSGAPPVAGGLRDGMGSFVDGLPNYL